MRTLALIIACAMAVAAMANITPECFTDVDVFLDEMPRLLREIEQYGDKMMDVQEKIKLAAAEAGVPVPIPTIDFRDPTTIIYAPLADSARLVVELNEKLTDGGVRLLRAQVDSATWVVEQNIVLFRKLNDHLNRANSLLVEVNSALLEAATDHLQAMHNNLTSTIGSLNSMIADWSGVSAVADAVSSFFDSVSSWF